MRLARAVGKEAAEDETGAHKPENSLNAIKLCMCYSFIEPDINIVNLASF